MYQPALEKVDSHAYKQRDPHAVIIIAVLNRTLRSWRLSGTITMQPDTASGGPIRWMWSTGTWIVGIYTTVLPV